MVGWGALIRNWKLVALAALAFAFGVMRVRSASLDAALARAREERDRLASYKETRKEMDDAMGGNDPDAARRWLHERGSAERP
jgi:hypothetical protein